MVMEWHDWVVEWRRMWDRRTWEDANVVLGDAGSLRPLPVEGLALALFPLLALLNKQVSRSRLTICQ